MYFTGFNLVRAREPKTRAREGDRAAPAPPEHSSGREGGKRRTEGGEERKKALPQMGKQYFFQLAIRKIKEISKQ